MIIEKLQNFGVIKEAKEPIEIKPLTIFMGDNSSGKSYLAMLVYGILKRSFDTDKEIENVYNLFKDTSIILKLFDFFNEIMQKKTTIKTLIISINEQQEILDIFNSFYLKNKSINKLLKNLFNISINIENLKIKNKFNRLRNINLIVGYNYEEGYTFTFDFNKIKVGGYVYSDDVDKKYMLENIIDYIIPILNNLINNNYVIYLPASRTGFMQTYKNLGSRAIQGFYSDDFEMQERQILNAPSRDFLDKLSFSKPYQENKIASMIEKEILRGEVLLDKDSNDIEFKLSSGEVLPIHALSSTITELMPLVIFLKRGYIKKDTLLIIEEPEAHLSFKNQRLMAKIIAMLLSEGVKVLITTHSDYLVYELNNLIRINDIKNTNYEEIKEKILNDELEDDEKKELLNRLKKIKEEDIKLNYKDVVIYNFLLGEDGYSTVSKVEVDEFVIANEYIENSAYELSKENNLLFGLVEYAKR